MKTQWVYPGKEAESRDYLQGKIDQGTVGSVRLPGRPEHECVAVNTLSNKCFLEAGKRNAYRAPGEKLCTNMYLVQFADTGIGNKHGSEVLEPQEDLVCTCGDTHVSDKRD